MALPDARIIKTFTHDGQSMRLLSWAAGANFILEAKETDALGGERWVTFPDGPTMSVDIAHRLLASGR
jgi:hypothetical protein